MKRIFGVAAIVSSLVSVSCKNLEYTVEKSVMDKQAVEFFKLPDGKSAGLYQLRTAGGFGVDVTDYGATIVAIYTPDRDGKIRNVALSWADPSRYINHPCYLGAFVGRLANRVSGGRFTLNGTIYQLMLNDRKRSTLHGGFGLSRRLWKVNSYTDKEVVFTMSSPDGDGGFPGALEITLRYRVSDECKLTMDIEAIPDRETVADFTSHVYLNLNGEGSGSCDDHEIKIKSARRTAVNGDLQPTGETPEVAGTAYDLREFRQFRNIFHIFPDGLDDNYILQDKCGVWTPEAAVVRSPSSGIKLTLNTDRPGVQFYMGGCLQAKPGRSGRYVRGGGFCLETQNWPDAVNHDNFPSAVISPEQPYRSRTEWCFETY